jgi:diadenosine tetraphosphate (Ap4A) HIT family hydrolase
VRIEPTTYALRVGLLARDPRGTSGPTAPIPFGRAQVSSRGFAHPEPRRHIPFITDLDGDEAATLGLVLARATRVLRDAAGAQKTCVYVFGDRTPRLHFNLAPHRDGDALRGGPGLLEPDAQHADRAIHEAMAAAAARALIADRRDHG